MPASILRFLCVAAGIMLAALSIICTLAAGSVVAAMAYVFFTEPRLSEHDTRLWAWATGIFLVGLPLSWASARLAQYGNHRLQKARFLNPDLQLLERQARWTPAVSTLVSLAMVACLAWAGSSGGPSVSEGSTVAWTVGFFLLLHAVILFHEAGHALAAHLAGMDPLSIQIGSGPLVRRWVTAGGFVWEWRLWPYGGYAQAVDRHPRPAAWRFFAYVAGGPVAGGLCVGLALYGFYRFGLNSSAPFAWMRARGLYPPLAFWPLYSLLAMATFSLWPHTGYRDGRLYYSDGWWLWRAFFLPEATYRDMAGGVAFAHRLQLQEVGGDVQAQREENFLRERFPERRALLTLADAQRHHQQRDLPRAEALFHQALAESVSLEPYTRVIAFSQHATALAVLHRDLPAALACCEAVLTQIPLAERASQLDAFACIPIFHRGAKELLPDAERWCLEALALSPDEITLRGTFAAVRFEQGQIEEAVPILEEVLAKTQSNDDRGIASFYLALAAGHGGRWREMATLRAQALRWCRIPAVLGRIHTELRPV